MGESVDAEPVPIIEVRSATSQISRAEIPSGSIAGPSIPDQVYRCPQDLAVTPVTLRRVLVVGSCLLTEWPDFIQTATPGCPCDYLVFNNTAEIPSSPPKPADAYDFQVVQIPLRSVLPDGPFFRMSYGDVDGYEKLFEMAKGRLSQFLQAAMRWNLEYGILTFVFNFQLPQQNPMGRLLPRYDLRNFVYFIEELNKHLDRETRKFNNAYIFDHDQVVATYGRKYFQDDSIWQSNHNSAIIDLDFLYDQERVEGACRASTYLQSKVSDYMGYEWAEILAMYKTIRQMDMVKLVVVDVDDTLWRGVAAEQSESELGLEALEGWPLGFAEALGHLKRRGVVLAIATKNDEGRVAQILSRSYGRRLCLDDFAVREINWQPKADSIEKILHQINVLPRNVVFIDDNPSERAAVKAAFPEIRVFGPNPLLWRRILLWSAETQVSSITAESAVRTEMVHAQVAGQNRDVFEHGLAAIAKARSIDRERKRQRQQMSRHDFLASLSLAVSLIDITDTDHPGFPRVLELINKTNQFNTTGKRWTKQECMPAVATGTRFIAFEVEDRFTEYGLVGVVVVREPEILQFVMSCRVVGMEVEIAALSEILRAIYEGGFGSARASLEETDRNLLCRDLYERCGFHRRADQWIRPLIPLLEKPSHIRISGGMTPRSAAAQRLNQSLAAVNNPHAQSPLGC
jgi:FkbH-like protein